MNFQIRNTKDCDAFQIFGFSEDYSYAMERNRSMGRDQHR